MSGFGIDPFGQFADAPDATEDPFGIAASARETQWWTPWDSGAQRRKKTGAAGWNQDGPPPSTVAPPRSATPNPSTTQRAILDAKQDDDIVGRLFGGLPPSRDTGASGDFNLEGGGVMKYQAPDPTNPGQQDAARGATVDNAALDEWRDSMKKAKELEDQALALPPRSGFGGIYDSKRERLYEGARVLRQRAAYAAASVPSSQPDPNRYKIVGNLPFDPTLRRADGGLGDFVYPDPEKMKGIHRASGGSTAAPHLETLIEPRTGKTVRVDTSLIPRNSQGQLVDRRFERNPALFGPLQEGVDSLGETKEEPYGVPDPAAVQAAEVRAKNPRPETEPVVNPLSAVKERRAIRNEIAEKLDAITHPARGTYWADPKRAGEAKTGIARLNKEQEDRLAEVDAAEGGGSKKKGGGATPAPAGKRVQMIWKNGKLVPAK